ncbi:UNVERIFIED_CONTAM: Receptor-like protein kinase [Sesamum radiatum]|uniref:Receptor-like protein kinase n=1 Tax=Sesamum radiatum TaxID=300843 RepID=A0AAW2PXX4_SESRA
MDISHNMLVGSLQVLSNLDNLVSLNVSYNNFSGSIPNTKFFQDLPNATFAGNEKLCFTKSKCHSTEDIHRRKSIRNLTILVVIIAIIVSIIVTAGTIFYNSAQETMLEKSDEEKGLQWDFTPFQKLNFTVEDVVTKLSDSNIVGRGCSGVVYRVETPTRQVIAVKKLWPKKKGEIPQRDLFSAEVATLGSIRHKNIVRLLGCCENGKTRLLLFDYISNGSLAGLLHEKKILLDWNARYNIIMGSSRFWSSKASKFSRLFKSFRHNSRIIWLYSSSYGIVLLEVLTGMEPTDSQIPDGKHIVTWVYEELREKHRDFTSIVDQQLLLRSGTQTEEMLQVLGIALLCVNPNPDERPNERCNRNVGRDQT